ncbi:MAG: ATP-binding protein [Gemmatimonadetes bacterium]|nr:ATP-binding protein [Gemmatimonadota bacterium]
MTLDARPRSSLNQRPQFAAEKAPKVPGTLAESGLSAETVAELVLKTLYVRGARTGQRLVEDVRLPFSILDDRLQDLQQRMLLEVRGAKGHGRGGYTFDLTSKGRERARESMAAGQYVGPAPVPLEKYRAWVAAGSIRNARLDREAIESGFSHLVLDPDFLEQIGPAVNSAKSMFLYGDSGNGKTTLAEAIARMMGGELYVPYAVEIGGHVMVVHDPVHHSSLPDRKVGPAAAADEEPEWLAKPTPYDRRFARVGRPVVFTGGELTLDQLDLQYDPHTKIYQAPFQVKANGGVLIIDDFGRQIVRPRDLLNRWIVPLEKRLDFLTLHTGHKFPVPFDCLLVFATNLDPLELVDEAFLRRIHYKILVPDPTFEQYLQIFRRGCIARQIAFEPDAVRWIWREYYERRSIPARSCHPRDLLDHLCDEARYLDVEPILSTRLLDRACRSYFLDMPGEGVGDAESGAPPASAPPASASPASAPPTGAAVPGTAEP